ncbi:hypothetical protein CDAR_119011 [Caerostris darwini]|uniref:Uncharacterized protein n=1 Tax=Caerostris darwini TaxID=1538125 RepID=A0AAV4VAE5_9ARAC|nr:hypothetical protein CDAR_119011 [Caerostris darwini]
MQQIQPYLGGNVEGLLHYSQFHANIAENSREQQPSSHPHPRPPSLELTLKTDPPASLLDIRPPRESQHSRYTNNTANFLTDDFVQRGRKKKNVPLTLSAIRARNFEDGDVPAHPFLRRRSGCRGADDKCERPTVRTE